MDSIINDPYLDQEFQDIDFSRPDQKQKFIDKVKIFVQESDTAQCRESDILLRKYFKKHPGFASTNSSTYDELELLQTQCQWTYLPGLEEEKVLGLFSSSINIGWDIPKQYNFYADPHNPFKNSQDLITQNLEGFISAIILYQDQDKFKNKLIDVLQDSNEVITKHKLIHGQIQYKPTLKHWFDIYFTEVGTGQVNKLKMAQFFTNNKNFQKLSSEEKAKIKTLFNIYEKLKLSSLSVQGNPVKEYMTDQSGRYGYLQYGQFYVLPIKTKKPEKPSAEEIISDDSTYHQASDEPKGVVEDIFSDIDEKEIAKHRNTSLSAAKLDYEQNLKDLKQKLHLTFTNQALERRFENLIISYLRGIRDGLELANILARSEKVGGLSYEPEVVEKILNYLKPQATKSVNADEDSQPDTIKKEAKPKLNLQQAKNLMKKAAINKKFASTSSPAPQPELPKKSFSSAKKPNIKSPQTSPPIPQVRRLQSTKPIVQDIKKTKPSAVQLIGPIEELAGFSLVKFRKLAENPIEAAQKIIDKIELLEEKSYDEKAKGVRALKNSSLNKLYLKIGNLSIGEGKSVQDIIDAMQAKGEPVLNKEEFDAIADLNKQIRF